VVRDLRANIASRPARAADNTSALIKACEDEGTKKTLTHLLTREITHANMFMKALDSIGKLDGPVFSVTWPPDDTVKLVFNLSQGQDERGPWNERRIFRLCRRPAAGRRLSARRRFNPDDEAEGSKSARS